MNKFFKDHWLGILVITIVGGIIASLIANYAYDTYKANNQVSHISVTTVDGQDIRSTAIKAHILNGPGTLQNCVTFNLKLINHGVPIKDAINVSYFLPPTVKILDGIGRDSSEFPPYTRNIQWRLVEANSWDMTAGYSPIVPFYLGFAPSDTIPKSFKMGLVLYTDSEILYRGQVALEMSPIGSM